MTRSGENREGKKRPAALISGSMDINVLTSFIFGVVFILFMIGFSVLFPNPTVFQIRVWITSLALSAAGIGAVLPGVLEIRYKNLLRASGAIGMFIIVFFFQPILEKSVPTFISPKEDPTPVADKFLNLVDDNKMEQAYNSLDIDSKRTIVPRFSIFEQLFESARKPLGKLVYRTLLGINAFDSPQGYPPGVYKVLSYRAKFSGSSDCRMEAISLRAGQDLEWHVFTYQISPTPIPC